MLGWILSLSIFLARAEAFENPPIRVRLEISQEKIELEGLGIQIHGRDQSYERVAIPQRQRVLIRRELAAPGRPVWKVERNGRGEIFTESYLALKAIDLKARGKSLPTQIFLSPQKQSKFDVIGILPLESYLVGVIASEMPLSWPLETLKAQAIAARSYALSTMKERARQIFHVESSILDQVFSHIGNGPDESPLVAKAKEAVKQTEGMVLLGEKQNVLKAYYHSDCGGKTASSKAVWGFGTSKGAAIDDSCPSNPKANWNLKVSQTSLSEKLKTFLKKQSFGLVQSLELLRPTLQDRVEKVRLTWDSGKRTLISAHELRAALGYDQMRSTFFEVSKSEGGYQFAGSGFGHGVGLCQWGARTLGKQGQSYEEILSHYYPHAQISSFGFKTEQRLEARTE